MFIVGSTEYERAIFRMLRNNFGLFFRNIVVYIDVQTWRPFIYHRRMATGTILVIWLKTD